MKTGNTYTNCGIPLTIVLLVITLASCLPVVGQAPVIDPQRAQFLPLSATAEIKGRRFRLEVARTPQQQARGLMFRPPLAPDQGMAFPYPTPRPLAFWMYNTPVPLDMIFLERGVVKALAPNVPPCTTDPCPVYPPGGVVGDLVIELRAGTIEKLNLQVGDKIKLQGI
ncbi:MAG: DUF192 domain-containing protein [Pseudanabaenaceae cyanobacterium SKYGB_i_bin29]|nr:DUF192 domain-containing protein [Pseudanabaenaceae cyanobacterium SKYG29]MDW8422657.1 DUF192 domain-containing protein [Pseudanabaenaceae cyanobacterium SKYGB_i_bin29]